MNTASKTSAGNFFEDFRVGREIQHATPRTLTEADATLNVGLYGSRFALNSSDVFARSLGLPRAPLDDLLVFHVVIGKTVNDISLNAVANLGYAEFRWGVPVYPGDTVQARSTVLGLRENSNKASGVVWVRSTGTNQKGEMVLDYVRWVMVHKRDPQAAVAAPVAPKTAPSVAPADMAGTTGVPGQYSVVSLSTGPNTFGFRVCGPLGTSLRMAASVTLISGSPASSTSFCRTCSGVVPGKMRQLTLAVARCGSALVAWPPDSMVAIHVVCRMPL